MPADLPEFSWGVGIEDTFVPQTRPGMRALDEYEITGHYRLWQEDFNLMKQVGVNHVRWGIPWYKVNPAPGVWDWEWVDQAMDYIVNKVGVIPIVDLMHYGTPLWMENSFINSDYPKYVAEYAYQVAARYKHLTKYYTPLNEPMVNALFCGKRGEWPPYLEGNDGYVKVLMQVARGVCLTEAALRQADPEAVIVQVEAVEHHWTSDERLGDRVKEENAHIYLPFDLFTGRVSTDHLLWPFLKQNGVTEAELEWLSEHKIKVDIFGVNYYPVSGGEWTMGENNEHVYTRGVELKEMASMLRMTWERYHLPMMVTETCINDSVPIRVKWMDGSIEVVRKAQADGLNMVGYTWWPLFDMIDWEYRLTTDELRRHMITGGLWACKFRRIEDIRREPTGLVSHFRSYITGKRTGATKGKSSAAPVDAEPELAAAGV